MKNEEVKFEEIESSHTLGVMKNEEVKFEEGVNDTLISYTLEYISLTDVDIKYLWGFIHTS
jgi:hypothetical protein